MKALPQIGFVTVLTMLMLFVPQISFAVGASKFHGTVHSTVLAAAQAITGGVVSATRINCVAEAALPHKSVAVHRRAMIFVLPQRFVTESLKEIVRLPASSFAVATSVSLVVVIAGHSSVTSAGAVMSGAVMSRTVMVCVQVERL